MKNLRLIPSFHRQEAVVKAKAHFAFDQDIITLVKSQKGARWSQTLRSWYFQKADFKLSSFYQNLKGSVFVDYAHLKKISTPTKKTKKMRKPNVKLPKGYLKQLVLKRYSQNTVKTYSSCFLTFMLFFKSQKLETIGKEEVKQFLLHLIEKEKVSASTQNQYINAIKFYYEKVLGQEKMVFTIERPRKKKQLPNVLSKGEVYRLLLKVTNIKHRCILSLIYSAGLRRSELLNLKIHDIDSSRNLVRINGGKGNKDRQSILSEKFLDQLREYFIKYKPKKWLLRMNKLKTKYNVLAQCKLESSSLSTALLAIY